MPRFLLAIDICIFVPKTFTDHLSVSQVIDKDYNLNEQIHLFDNATNQRLSIGFAWFLMKGYMEVGGKYLMLHLCKT